MAQGLWWHDQMKIKQLLNQVTAYLFSLSTIW